MSSYPENLRRAIRDSRQIIMELLDGAYPITVRQDELLEGLSDPGLPRPQGRGDTLKDLEYLAQLGLIERRAGRSLAGEPVIRWTLTARGKQFAEANMPWARVTEF